MIQDMKRLNINSANQNWSKIKIQNFSNLPYSKNIKKKNSKLS